MKSAAKTKKKKYCLGDDCKREPTAMGYCRMCYIKNWKTIRLNSLLKAERRLNAYVDRLAKKYPKDYLERIKAGIESEDKFQETVEELELDNEKEYTETDREYLEKFVRKIKTE